MRFFSIFSLSVGSNMKQMNFNFTEIDLKTTNWTISTLVMLTNLYFLPCSFIHILKNGGPMGYGLLVLPISLSVNLLLVTSGLTFKNIYSRSIILMITNALGLIWATFWLWLLLTTPKID